MIRLGTWGIWADDRYHHPHQEGFFAVSCYGHRPGREGFCLYGQECMLFVGSNKKDLGFLGASQCVHGASYRRLGTAI